MDDDSETGRRSPPIAVKVFASDDPFNGPASMAVQAARPPVPITRLHTIAASRLNALPVTWLWPERIAIGALTVLAGDPGLGKSLIALDLAARVSRGAPWPDGTPNPGGSVLVIAAEDAPDTAIVPRLMAAGADCTKIHILERVSAVACDGSVQQRDFALAADTDALLGKLRMLDEPRLVIVDPIAAYLSGAGTRRSANVRAALAPLAEAARSAGVAVLAVTHLRKNAGGKAIHRLSGSLAFVTAARAVYIVPEEGVADAQGTAPDARRLLLQIKNNVSRHPNGSSHAFGFQCAAPFDEIPRIVWEDEPVMVDLKAAFEGERGSRRDGGRLGEAMAWLAQILAQEPVAAAAVMAAAETAVIPYRRLRRAAETLGVVRAKDGFGGAWLWALAPKAPNGAKDAHEKDLDAFGENDGAVRNRSYSAD